MVNRRELLRGTASASALAFAFGCGGAGRNVRKTTEVSADVRAWLRDAVELLAGSFPTVHALAVSRQRTTGARDVLGRGVARARRDGVVLAVADAGGGGREEVTSDLSAAGIAAAARALATGKRKSLAPIPPPVLPPSPQPLIDSEIHDRLDRIAALDEVKDSRIVYAATSLDLDDVTVWSISPGHDREQRTVRIQTRILRVAWNGTRPVITERELAWTGGIDDRAFDAEAVNAVSRRALQIMTPGAFDDRVYPVVLDPSVTATVVDAGVRALLTSTAARRPEVGKRLALGATLAAPGIDVTDDPTQRGAYGGFQFDDEGEVAAPQPLVAEGRVVGVLSDHAGGGRGRARRPGHVGPLGPGPSHLKLAPGTVPHRSLRGDGLVIEGGVTASVDPSTSRVVAVAATAREVRGGEPTGRVFADVELVGELRELLEAVDGVAAETATIAYRDEHAGEPLWRSIEAPWLRTRALVRGRRPA